MAKKETQKEKIKRLQEENDKLNNNLNMLKHYFREYNILEHYLAWIKAKAEKTPLPKKLTLVE